MLIKPVQPIPTPAHHDEMPYDEAKAQFRKMIAAYKIKKVCEPKNVDDAV